MEPHRGTVGKPSRERAEPENASAGRALSNRPDGGRDLCLGVRGRLARRRRRTRARPSAGDRASGARRRRGACRRRSAPRSAAAARAGRAGRGRRAPPGGRAVVTKIGRPRAYSGWSRLPAATAYAVSGSDAAAARHASSAPASPDQKSATPRLSWTTALLRVQPREPIHPVDRSVRPGRERLADPSPRASRCARTHGPQRRASPPRRAARHAGAPSPAGLSERRARESAAARPSAPWERARRPRPGRSGARRRPRRRRPRLLAAAAVQATTRANGDTAPR